MRLIDSLKCLKTYKGMSEKEIIRKMEVSLRKDEIRLERIKKDYYCLCKEFVYIKKEIKDFNKYKKHFLFYSFLYLLLFLKCVKILKLFSIKSYLHSLINDYWLLKKVIKTYEKKDNDLIDDYRFLEEVKYEME
jgi:hypothetical protein